MEELGGACRLRRELVQGEGTLGSFQYWAAKEMACAEDSFNELGKQMQAWDIPNNKDCGEFHGR